MYRKIVYSSLTVLWMGIIFWFSSQTSDNSSSQSIFITERIIRLFIDSPSPALLSFSESLIRKLAHFTEYFILGFFVFNTVKAFQKK